MLWLDVISTLCLWLPLLSLVRGGMVEYVDYRGWSGAVRISNGVVETMVVPAVGRIMSFRFLDGPNILWEDPDLGGRKGNGTDMKAWRNFGGDKAWPAPDKWWQNYTSSEVWMPPCGFDGQAASASVPADRELSVILSFPTDPHYGVKLTRQISLHPSLPEMAIETSVLGISPAPAVLSLWVVTQLKDPTRVYFPQPSAHAKKIMKEQKKNYTMFGNPKAVEFDHMLGLVRDATTPYKVRSDADFAVWQDSQTLCVISTIQDKRVRGDIYPDVDSHFQMYSNPDPKPYIELESMGPLRTVSQGVSVNALNLYQLRRAPGQARQGRGSRSPSGLNH
eukprot:gb/GEZN01007736.1/.p1 GENE.gb/GEZN01007736.1/~~gb/GEZN01007736.1/.p1  ORF type:complete len:335 (+),score=14.25 gb/GEZN01007736.1/:43-1047(+)